MSLLARRKAILVFLAFALAYFLSALIRAITGTLSPVLTVEFKLSASELGLLAGGYFLGFAATQLPLGTWLDAYGPKRVIVCFLAMAVLGCVAFSLASGFAGLLMARILCGVGVSACLMAPLTGYRRWLDGPSLLRANSWMLMTGSLGMVASTLPVQWLVPVTGWRPLFLGLAVMLLVAMAVIVWQVPGWPAAGLPADGARPAPASYSEVWRHPAFRRMAPIGFFIYGGLLAMQTLWVVPWMTQVAGYSPLEAATGVFWINIGMLFSFWGWGLVSPWLAHRGYTAARLITLGMPLSFLALAIIIIADNSISTGATAIFMLYFMSCTFISLAQPAVGMAFPANLAGRALSAYNLVIFSGIFVIQWGIGLLIDACKRMGFTEIQSFKAAFGVFLLCCVGSYWHFLMAKSHNQGIERYE